MQAAPESITLAETHTTLVTADEDTQKHIEQAPLISEECSPLSKMHHHQRIAAIRQKCTNSPWCRGRRRPVCLCALLTFVVLFLLGIYVLVTVLRLKSISGVELQSVAVWTLCSTTVRIDIAFGFVNPTTESIGLSGVNVNLAFSAWKSIAQQASNQQPLMSFSMLSAGADALTLSGGNSDYTLSVRLHANESGIVQALQMLSNNCTSPSASASPSNSRSRIVAYNSTCFLDFQYGATITAHVFGIPYAITVSGSSEQQVSMMRNKYDNSSSSTVKFGSTAVVVRPSVAQVTINDNGALFVLFVILFCVAFSFLFAVHCVVSVLFLICCVPLQRRLVLLHFRSQSQHSC